MLQVADEIFFDLQVALVDVRHPRQLVHVRDHLALGVVLDLAVLVPVGKPGDAGKLAALGDFLAGVVKFLAADPVDGLGRFQGLGGQHHGVRADEADLGAGLLLLDGLGHLAIVLQRRRGGVDDDVVVILGDGQALRHTDVQRGAVQQARIGRERGGLRQPSGIPIAGDFAARLITRARAAVKTVKTRWG